MSAEKLPQSYCPMSGLRRTFHCCLILKGPVHYKAEGLYRKASLEYVSKQPSSVVSAPVSASLPAQISPPTMDNNL